MAESFSKSLQKTFVRRYALDTRRRKPASVYFTLPGVSCADIIESRRRGIIDESTVILAVEREKDRVETIENKLHSMLFYNTHVFNKHLHKISEYELRGVLNQFTDTQDGIDLVFLDTCGQMDYHTWEWIHTVLSPHLNKKRCDFISTFVAYARSESKKRLCETMESDPKLAGLMQQFNGKIGKYSERCCVAADLVLQLTALGKPETLESVAYHRRYKNEGRAIPMHVTRIKVK